MRAGGKENVKGQTMKRQMHFLLGRLTGFGQTCFKHDSREEAFSM